MAAGGGRLQDANVTVALQRLLPQQTARHDLMFSKGHRLLGHLLAAASCMAAAPAAHHPAGNRHPAHHNPLSMAGKAGRVCHQKEGPHGEHRLQCTSSLVFFSATRAPEFLSRALYTLP